MSAALEELVNSLYDLVQEARSVPLSAEKCMLDRERALDILDEIRTNMPTDLKMARDIVEKRTEIIAAGKKEAEDLRRKAEEYARKTINESTLMAAAEQQAQQIVSNAEMQAQQIVGNAEMQAQQLRAAVSAYCTERLSATENCAANALEEIRKCRAQFEQLDK